MTLRRGRYPPALGDMTDAQGYHLVRGDLVDLQLAKPDGASLWVHQPGDGP